MKRQLLHLQTGFSLIELMIAIAVVGLLAAVALPNFMDSIRKGRRSEAFTALSGMQQAQERIRSNSSTYATSVTAAPPAGLGLAAATPGGYYTLALTNVSPTGYDAVATAVSGKSQAQDGSCAKLAVQMNGGNIRYASNTSGGALTYAATDKCWSR